MKTKFRQKYAKIAHILVPYKIWRRFCTCDRVFGIDKFKYAIGIFQGANGVSMATKFKQKKQNWNKFGHNFGPTRRFCTYDRVFGIDELKYAIGI